MKESQNQALGQVSRKDSFNNDIKRRLNIKCA